MWAFDEAIEEHLEMVDKDRKDRFGSSDDDDDEYSGPFEENEYAAQLKKAHGITR